jgi:hypothetical protein
MSTLSVAQVRTDLDTSYRGDTQAWQLLAEVLEGKLDVQTLCERQQMRLDEVQGWLRERHRCALLAFDEQLKRALIRQGASPDAFLGPELSISLTDVSIIDWIQAIQIFAKHAVITVFHDDGESRVWCSQGAVVDASSGRLRGEAAVYRIAALERGQVVTELRPVNRERTIRTSTAWLLLEAVRRKDETGKLELKLGGLDRHFQCTDGGALNRSLNTAQASLLGMFDQPRPLAEVVAQSEIGDVETLAALDGLIRSGQLVEAGPESQERPKVLSPGPDSNESSAPSVVPIAFAWPHERAPQRGHWRWGVSTLAMGLLVSAAAWLGAQASADKAPAAAPPALPPPPPAAVPAMYPVAVRSYPLEAELQVDGRVVGRGVWTANMARDGSVHELRVSAEGFVPLRIVFVDTSPPVDIRLEPLPPSTTIDGAAGPAASAPSNGPSTVERPAPPRPRRKRSPGALGSKAANSTAASTSASVPGKSRPFVQIIDGSEGRTGSK